MPFAGCTADVLHDPLRRRFRMHGFLSHLHSLMVTMSQKSFVPQADKSVSQVLMSDTPENGALVAAEEADLILALVAAPEIGAVPVVHQREDAAAHRHPRRARVPGLLPCRAKNPDLLRLLDMKWAAALVDLECRALQVHPELGRPLRGGV